MSISKFTIEKIYEKKKNINNNNNEINCFCIASNFNLPYQISFKDNESVDIFFDKISASNNFYVALDEPILPQVCGNYSITWSFRYEILSSISTIFKATIKTNCSEKEFEFNGNDLNIVNHNLFTCVIPCKGFAAGDGIIFEINSNESSGVNIISNKVDITYYSSFDNNII